VTADETGFRIFVTENKCLVEPASKQTRQEDFLATWSNFSKYEQPNHHQTASLNGRRHEAPRLPQQMGISAIRPPTGRALHPAQRRADHVR